MNHYLKVLGFQLSLTLACNQNQEFLMKTEEYKKQLETSLNIIKELEPNLIIYPEMSYDDNYEKTFLQLSKERIIVAGSIYRDKINTTIVFQDGIKREIPKQFASGAEPMVRIVKQKKPTDFTEEELEEHTFYIQNKKIMILNCMEYYHLAYYLARTIPDLFAIVCPCSNNNPKVFKEESRALHNHNENIYSFIVNCISSYNGKPYGTGTSYIYGPIRTHEKEWLQKEEILSDDHVCSILNLGSLPSYFHGEFTNNLVPYGRSDGYCTNPKNIQVKKLIKEKQK